MAEQRRKRWTSALSQSLSHRIYLYRALYTTIRASVIVIKSQISRAMRSFLIYNKSTTQMQSPIPHLFPMSILIALESWVVHTVVAMFFTLVQIDRRLKAVSSQVCVYSLLERSIERQVRTVRRAYVNKMAAMKMLHLATMRCTGNTLGVHHVEALSRS